ncbi:hypothetical protein GCM10011519_25270 [Marmoricola endophyticus]|uniref:Asp23/Gls24 family envelope stress response protein n=1 Tax=Marmoricola endophyticus TaxID=2040280 RepID=A0A917BMX1_9ACTN|nr:Asp23/Gls24 family envelope stress response protein [Marmoricola endophyticus]GGF50245.1 hypothetical protein GCM10011519_25270 [Marmoricola endophyticus]
MSDETTSTDKASEQAVSTPGKSGTTTPQVSTKGAATAVKATEATASPSVLISDHGRTTIADAVVSKIAGIATREVRGVYALGSRTDRAVGALRGRIPGSSVNVTQGISVEVGETQAAVDIQLIAEYGFALADLAGEIRASIIAALEEMTGLEVTEVNIEIQDVHLSTPEEEAEAEPAQPRVQ